MEDIGPNEVESVSVEDIEPDEEESTRPKVAEKSRIRETKNLSTDADSRTGTILERLHDFSQKRKEKKKKKKRRQIN